VTKRIRAGSVHPTAATTGMSAFCCGHHPKADWPYRADTPPGRRAVVKDVAGPIVFSADDSGSVNSGVCLPVGGGCTAHRQAPCGIMRPGRRTSRRFSPRKARQDP
jgi:NAD(P)-dependent dehydrogenase (short-subunit alcohol dehydrogenase family)